VATLLLSGRLMNALKRATITGSPGLHASFGAAFMVDEDPGTLCRLSAYAATSWWLADLNIIVNPTLDTDSTGWTFSQAGTGVASRTTAAAEVDGGTGGAISLVGGNSQAVAIQDIEVPAGAWWRTQFRDAGNGSNAAGALRIFNMNTGKYLTSGGAWQSGAIAAITGQNGPYAAAGVYQGINFQVESYEACRSDTVILRHIFRSSVNQVWFVDNITSFPGVDFCGVFGHTIQPFWTPTLRSSTDAFATVDTLQATLAPLLEHPSIYAYLGTMQYARHWRVPQLVFGGTAPSGTWSPTAPGVGDVVLGQAKVLTLYPIAPQSTPWQVTHRMPQVRHDTPGGGSFVSNLGSEPIRGLKLPFEAVADTEDKELLLGAWKRSGHGETPLVVVPENSEAMVLYGRAPGARDARRVWFSPSPRHQQELAIEELGFGIR